MIVYLDASALVKLYVQEPGFQETAQLAERAEVLGTALISRAEVAAALARAARRQVVTAEEAEVALRVFFRQWEHLHCGLRGTSVVGLPTLRGDTACEATMPFISPVPSRGAKCWMSRLVWQPSTGNCKWPPGARAWKCGQRRVRKRLAAEAAGLSPLPFSAVGCSVGRVSCA